MSSRQLRGVASKQTQLPEIMNNLLQGPVLRDEGVNAEVCQYLHRIGNRDWVSNACCVSPVTGVYRPDCFERSDENDRRKHQDTATDNQPSLNTMMFCDVTDG